jgi:hypothetical protein
MNTFLMVLIFFSLNFETPVQNRTSWVGTISNGYKGDSIRFDISADGKRLENLTFTGYWRCSGGIEQMTMGPEKSFSIKDGKVLGVITEPENGGASAFRFDLNAVISGKSASGTLRINLNALGCDTYQLKWTAIRK